MSLFRRRTADTPASEEAVSETPDATPTSGRPQGPWDASEVDLTVGRLDLGSLLISPTQGLELRIEMDQETDTIAGIQLIVGESAAQVQAFAAPRSGGQWDEIRDELAASIVAAGGTVEQEDGEFGSELRVRLPQVSPEGRTVFAPARFLGIEGPRWFVRAVVSGRAALDTQGVDPVIEALRGLVVVRGAHPMAPRELLPLRLPETTTEEPAQPATPSLDPFERGPEITEVH
ncbi:MAG: DUF3710 domain-containing protein [Tetrasphaera jenkinsii]|nr:DUF3710 domain-containing protein [Tetrasphaera jenkinsii]